MGEAERFRVHVLTERQDWNSQKAARQLEKFINGYMSKPLGPYEMLYMVASFWAWRTTWGHQRA